MQTNILSEIRNTPDGREAESILRKCVHCGFCTATCPTYQLLGDELDGPRGRIYLIKQLLEGKPASEKTMQHLDRCLTCRSCETTCPSGVHYSRLLDVGRRVLEPAVSRSLRVRILRYLLKRVIPSSRITGAFLFLGRSFSPFLPRGLQKKIPALRNSKKPLPERHERKMLLHPGCIQAATSPDINTSTQRVLSRLGIESSGTQPGCCGAVHYHLNDIDTAKDMMRRNIDEWHTAIQQGNESIVFTASGCTCMVKEYAHIFRDDPQYAQKASDLVQHLRDIGEVLQKENRGNLSYRNTEPGNIAFHAPCTLQHGLQSGPEIEEFLKEAGYTLLPVQDAHLCCGSAGTYSVLQPELSQKLLHNKLDRLQKEQPAMIATANIGCMLHLETESKVPVRHWIELIDQQMAE